MYRTAAIAALTVVAVSGCAAGQSSSTESAAPQAATPTPEVTVTVTATPTPTPERTKQSESPAAKQSRTPRAKQPKPAKAPKVVTVPDVVGLNYQKAQNQWRARDLIVMPAKDASGERRWALLDSNWYVVDQKPAAGTQVEVGTPVRASILKYSD